MLYDQLVMATNQRDPEWVDRAIKDLEQACKGITKKHNRLMMLARAEIPIYKQEIEEEHVRRSLRRT